MRVSCLWTAGWYTEVAVVDLDLVPVPGGTAGEGLDRGVAARIPTILREVAVDAVRHMVRHTVRPTVHRLSCLRIDRPQCTEVAADVVLDHVPVLDLDRGGAAAEGLGLVLILGQRTTD